MKNVSSMFKGLSVAYLLLAVLLLISSGFVLLPRSSNAATLSSTYIRLSRMKSGQASAVRLVFKAASSQTSNVAIDFNGTDTGTAQWTNATPGGVVNGTQTATTAQCVTDGFTALPTSSSLAASGTGSVITITNVGATTSGSTYCVDLTGSAVTNPTAGHEGEYHPTVTLTGDSTTVAVRIIAQDQIAVTATVPPTFNFQFNNTTTDAFGTLSTANVVTTTGKTITLTTNAATGWVVWAKSTNGSGGKGALQSATASNYKITSSSTLGTTSHNLSTGTEDYGLGTTINTDAAGGGTVSLDAAYDGSGSCPSTCKAGVLDSQNFRPIASANGTASGDIINVFERATIAGSTPAANDYTDTITFIGAGSF